MPIKPNTLVEYEGGGYDGCIWEYNWAWIDFEGEFHDIYSSGCRGCYDMEDLQEFLNDKHNIEYNNFTLYDLNNEKECKKFALESCIRGVIGCANWLAEHSPKGNPLLITCDVCGQEKDAGDAHGENYSGCGGTAMAANDIICEECHSLGTCAYCGEYYGHEEIDNDTGYCKYCKEHKNV